MASLYGKLAIFLFAAWAGLDAGGVITGLAVCGVMFASVGAASDLMQDFRTGWAGWRVCGALGRLRAVPAAAARAAAPLRGRASPCCCPLGHRSAPCMTAPCCTPADT